MEKPGEWKAKSLGNHQEIKDYEQKAELIEWPCPFHTFCPVAFRNETFREIKTEVKRFFPPITKIQQLTLNIH